MKGENDVGNVSRGAAEAIREDMVRKCSIRRLHKIISRLSGPQHEECFSVESLIDIMICLYDECANSTLRKEKQISQFVEFGK